MSTLHSTSGPAVTGYTCSSCGGWIAYGVTGSHYCGGSTAFPIPSPDPAVLALGRIEALLHRIIDKLEES